MDHNTHDVSGDSEAMLSFFYCSKFSVRDYNTYDIPTGKTFTINWLKIQLSRVSHYLHKMTFSVYKSPTVTTHVCDFFVSKVIKITRYFDWYHACLRFLFKRSDQNHLIYGYPFLRCCFQRMMTKSWNQPVWLLKLTGLCIHSFMHVHNISNKKKFSTFYFQLSA